MKERHLMGLAFLAGLSGAADEPTLGGKIDKLARTAMLTVIFLVTLKIILWLVLWPILLPLKLMSMNAEAKATSTGETSGPAKVMAAFFLFIFVVALLPVFDPPVALRPYLAGAVFLVILSMCFESTRNIMKLVGYILILVVAGLLGGLADWLGRRFRGSS